MAITIDGSASNVVSAITTNITVTLSTSKTNDIVVVEAYSERANSRGSHATVSSISDTAGLSWAKRSSITLDNSGNGNAYTDFEVWWALSAGALPGDVITVTFSALTDTGGALAFGVNGANTSSPWDANGSLPATATGTSPSIPTVSGISTTAANNIVLGFLAYLPLTSPELSESAGTVGGLSATLIRNQPTIAAEYLIANGSQSSISASFGSNESTWLMIADAIVPAPRAPLVFSDSIREAIAASDSLANTMTMPSALSDSVASSDSVSPGNVYVNQISDAMTAADNMIGSLIWNDVSAPGGTWTDANSVSSNWSTVAPVTNTTWTKK